MRSASLRSLVVTAMALCVMIPGGCGALSATGGPASDGGTPNPDPTCTPAPGFSAIQRCVLLTTCVGAEGCHGCSTSEFALEYSGPFGLVNTPVFESVPGQSGLLRVAPGHPESSYLLWKLEGDPRIAGTVMPPNGTPVSAGWLAAIQTWIADGAPND